jgi:hypothetical protein
VVVFQFNPETINHESTPATTGAADADPRMNFSPLATSGVPVNGEGGDASLPIWSGCYWRDGEAPPDAAATVMALVTRAGQRLLFDVDQGSNLRWPATAEPS